MCLMNVLLAIVYDISEFETWDSDNCQECLSMFLQFLVLLFMLPDQMVRLLYDCSYMDIVYNTSRLSLVD